ncbi:MAG: tetratricopeptide repeat protein [bacterium]
MDINTGDLKTNHISHSDLKSMITKRDCLSSSPEIREHTKYCNRCNEIIQIIKDAQEFAGQTKPDTQLNHASRLYLSETIAKLYEHSLTPKEAANFLSHLAVSPHCFDYVKRLLEDSLTPLPENIEKELALYSRISIAEQALQLTSPPLEPTEKPESIWEKIENMVKGTVQTVRLRPAPSFALLAALIIGIVIGQSQFKRWRAAVHTKAGMIHLQKAWTITDEDLRPAPDFPLSIFSVTHGTRASEGTDPAVQDFKTALEWDKNSRAAKRGLAIYWCFAAELERADSLLRALLEQDDSDYEAWNILGLVAARHDDNVAALNAFERALEILPDYPEAAYNRAMILQQLGRQEEAKKAWQDYLIIDNRSEWSKVAQRRLSSIK